MEAGAGAAGMGVGILFTRADPTELIIRGRPLHAGRTAVGGVRCGVYTLGFFILWVICATASATSRFFQTTSRANKSTKV